MKYLFGNIYPQNGKKIEADSIEFAIYKFAYTENDIYKYVNNNEIFEYNYDLNKYILKENCYDEAEINIYVDK